MYCNTSSYTYVFTENHYSIVSIHLDIVLCGSPNVYISYAFIQACCSCLSHSSKRCVSVRLEACAFWGANLPCEDNEGCKLFKKGKGCMSQQTLRSAMMGSYSAKIIFVHVVQRNQQVLELVEHATLPRRAYHCEKQQEMLKILKGRKQSCD